MVLLLGLGGAGLSADPVARHIGLLAGARRLDHALQNGAAALAGLFADDLPHLGWLGVLENVPIGVGDALHHIGLHQVAVVNYRGRRGEKLDGRDLEPLAKGGRGQVGDAVGAGKEVTGPEHAVIGLPHHVNAGLVKRSRDQNTL